MFKNRFWVKRLLYVYVIFLFLTACIYNTETDNNSSIENISEKVPVTFYFPGKQKKDVDKVLKKAEEKTKEALNIVINFKWIPYNSYEKEIYKLLCSGDGFEVFYYSDAFDMTGDPHLSLRKLLQEGYISDISAILKKYTPGLYKSYKKKELSFSTVEGQLVGLPAKYFVSRRPFVIIREDFEKKYAVKGIYDYSGFQKILSEIKRNHKEIVPLGLYKGTMDLFALRGGYVIFNSRLGLVYREDDPNMKLVQWENTPEYKKALSILKNWYEEEYILEKTYEKLEFENIESEKYACFIDGFEKSLLFNTVNKSKLMEAFKYEAYALNPEKKAQRSSPMKNSLLFNAGSENLEYAMMLVEWIQSEQSNYDLMIYGIEGDHYTFYGNQYRLPSGINYNDHNYMGWNGHKAFLNMDFCRTGIYNSPLAKEYYMDMLTEKTEYAGHYGFYAAPGFENSISDRIKYFRVMDRPDLNYILNYNNNTDYKLFNTEFHETVEQLQMQFDSWRRKN